jgi:hypothetical protein
MVGEAHEVAVPRGLKVQSPESDFEPGGEGVRAAQRVPRYSVRITMEGVGGMTLGAQIAPRWAPTVGAECGPDTNQ